MPSLTKILTPGVVRDLDVDFAPSEILAEAALHAVSNWKYKPYLLNGKPVDVKTDFMVAFTLSPQH